ncbi:thioesterase family protein [Fomitiporia mediterranea MF3/22]|uniref:thioesterase family protein n=1 Tax=Fomitiporia mediterranea (strain MF3/22) TaxID=694068 RepID=UPI0004407A59|nr:thioesterase family protein [Fomitiporia mediterranea MF3/22]EJD03391.1 thioesterase family protein [Fomitiporia mediterranea MF3/22]
MQQDTKDSSRPIRNDYHYFLTYRTRWSDNDQYSHVNNAIYYHLIDSVVNTYLAERCGCRPSVPSSPNGNAREGPPIGLVVSSYCNFFAPLSFPEPVTLGLRVVKLGKSSVSYEVGFFSGAEDEEKRNEEPIFTKAVGGYTHVFVDRVHRRPVKEMNATLRDGLRAILWEPSAKSKL